MPTFRKPIQKITLTNSASSITFSNIPQNYTDLKILVSARTSDAGDFSNASLRFNGDSGGNYSYRGMYAYTGSNISGATSGATEIVRVYCTNSGATANTYGNSEIYIPNYSVDGLKTAVLPGTTEKNSSTGPIISASVGSWTNTSPITSIYLGGNFVAGSTFYLYGITHVPIINGGEISIRDGFKYHTFRSTGTLQVVEPGDVEYLVVAGGGSGGGQYEGGGGGAGGLLSGKARLNTGIQTLTIGAGGSPAAQSTDGGNNGSDTTAFEITATGGGRGGRYSSVAGASGGSGGGGGGPSGGGASGTTGQGSSGGNGSTQAGGGGGGAGAAGSNASSNTGGAGGAGRLWANNYYAGGGGGGATTTPGSGGIGGGGSGANYTVGAISGTANTGGGGGGIRENVGITAGAGGSGIVVIRYPYDGN